MLNFRHAESLRNNREMKSDFDSPRLCVSALKFIFFYFRTFSMRAQAFEFRELFYGVQAALSKATETRKPNGSKISCKVSKVGLPLLERIL